MEQSRTAFEYWFSDQGKSPKAVEKNHNGNYLLAQAEGAWIAWGVACRKAHEQCAGNKEAVQALRVIRTWVSVDGALVPKHVIDLADRVLESHNA